VNSESLRGVTFLTKRLPFSQAYAGWHNPNVARRTPEPLLARLGRRNESESQALEGMQRTIVIGAGSGGQVLVWELQANPRWGLLPIGFVDDDPDKIGRRYLGLSVLGPTTSLPTFAHAENVDVVIVAVPSATPAAYARLVAIAKMSAACVLSLPHIGSMLTGVSRLTTLKSVRPADVLGRPVVQHDSESCSQFVVGERVLVTGAAGSIGSELAKQISDLSPEHLVLVDTNETGLHDLTLDIRRSAPGVNVSSAIASVTDSRRIERVFADHRPGLVVHAAAYKHVPSMEQQPDQAVETNVIGSEMVARYAARYGASRFVLVSTDKAVRPTSVMGATKRLAELAVEIVSRETGLPVCSVRFGNVLGSRGSVIPTFERQIREGGPVTVTDPGMRRYFMTIPEAVSLIIQAGAFRESNVTYILDMGEDVSILELAKRVIEMHGLRVGRDIDIVFTGMRPGEKLYEELSLDFESARATGHPKIRQLDGFPSFMTPDEIRTRIADVCVRALRGDHDLVPCIHQLIAEIDGSSPALDGLTDPSAGKPLNAEVKPITAAIVAIPIHMRDGRLQPVISGPGAAEGS
jgi:FlaA1/EpsC-like NDP-sugar epimerase